MRLAHESLIHFYCIYVYFYIKCILFVKNCVVSKSHIFLIPELKFVNIIVLRVLSNSHILKKLYFEIFLNINFQSFIYYRK